MTSFFPRFLFFIFLLVSQIYSVNMGMAFMPDEILDDPKLEQRARDIGKDLRCVVCQNQTIDESDADLARDLRLLVRKRLKAGDNDEEVKEYIVARYGDFVLMTPPFRPSTYILWFAPLLLLAFGLLIVFYMFKGKNHSSLSFDTANDADGNEKKNAPLKEHQQARSSARPSRWLLVGILLFVGIISGMLYFNMAGKRVENRNYENATPTPPLTAEQRNTEEAKFLQMIKARLLENVNDVGAWLQLINFYLRHKDLAQARDALKYALIANPDNERLKGVENIINPPE